MTSETYYFDRFETNPIHAAEREEAHHAAQFATGACYRHSYVSNKHGGGVCPHCGDEIGAEEL